MIFGSSKKPQRFEITRIEKDYGDPEKPPTKQRQTFFVNDVINVIENDDGCTIITRGYGGGSAFYRCDTPYETMIGFLEWDIVRPE